MAKVTKKTLAVALIKLGYSHRRAHVLVDLVLSSLKNGLLRDGKVESPIGTFVVTNSPRERRLWRLEKIVTIFKQKKRIRLKSRGW